MISCKRAAELISKEADEPLSLREQFQLRIHLFVCEFCEQFRRNLGTIRKAILGLPEEKKQSICETSETFKQKLKDAIKSKTEEK